MWTPKLGRLGRPRGWIFRELGGPRCPRGLIFRYIEYYTYTVVYLHIHQIFSKLVSRGWAQILRGEPRKKSSFSTYYTSIGDVTGVWNTEEYPEISSSPRTSGNRRTHRTRYEKRIKKDTPNTQCTAVRKEQGGQERNTRNTRNSFPVPSSMFLLLYYLLFPLFIFLGDLLFRWISPDIPRHSRHRDGVYSILV